jgi:hypothetical protein
MLVPGSRYNEDRKAERGVKLLLFTSCGAAENVKYCTWHSAVVDIPCICWISFCPRRVQMENLVKLHAALWMISNIII